MPDWPTDSCRPDLPWVTCLCPTYGRFELLRLALACFLAQDYPNKCMMILNDAPEPIRLSERLTITARQARFDWAADYVEVINAPKPYPTLGEKRQALLEAARTPLVAHWDDDDLYLPWHLSRCVGALCGAPGATCVKARGAWFMVGPPPPPSGDGAGKNAQPPLPPGDGAGEDAQPPLPPGEGRGEGAGLRVRGIHHNVFEGQMVFDRKRALALGGYPPWHSGQARHLLGKFHRAGQLYKIPDSMGLTSYVYRWGQGVTHISALKNREGSGWTFREANRDFGDGRPLTPGDLSPYWTALLKGAYETLSNDDYERLEEGFSGRLSASVSEATQ